jgi:hypothetical protein
VCKRWQKVTTEFRPKKQALTGFCDSLLATVLLIDLCKGRRRKSLKDRSVQGTCTSKLICILLTTIADSGLTPSQQTKAAATEVGRITGCLHASVESQVGD